MSAKGKIKSKSDKISIKEPEKDNSYPVFCFKHITTNKKHNINFFKKDVNAKTKAYGALFYLIDDMQNSTWRELFSRRKETGFESIPYKEIKLKPNSYKITPDSKVISIRFKRQNYRMIGVKENDIFHVFGFDFDYSAYDHGK